MSTPVKVGIVGLGRWAKVLTRAAKQSDKVQIVAGYSRSQEKRDAFAKEMGVPFLGRIPLAMDIRAASDAGQPPAAGNGPHAGAFMSIAEQLAAWIRTHGG